MKSSDNRKLAFLFLLALVIAAANIWVWNFFATSKPATSTSEIGQTQTAASPTNILSPTVADDTAAIKKVMAEKLDKNEDNLEMSVSKNTGQFAKGTVKEKTEAGGAYFLAARKDGQWIIVYDGQSQPPCKDLNTYNFPKDLAPECLNASGLVVKR